jgi:hypothetical protein
MPEPSATPVIPNDPDALRLVLFGLPGAGKSSLLGALGQAAQVQPALLNGQLTDLSHGLQDLRQRLYETGPRRTEEEIAPYPVEVRPLSGTGAARAAVLIDCDGAVANDLLERRRELDEKSPEGTLARAILKADALILLVDASAPEERINKVFEQFKHFLHLLEEGRGMRIEVGGLPVFVVLTKCDLLAEPRDSVMDWMELIEQRKRELDEHFRAFLARDTTPDGSIPFGRIALNLWATAVKRPPLGKTPARPREPFGVAELFRQSLDKAEAYEERRSQASRRLMWTAGTAAGLATLMLSLTVGLAVYNQEKPRSELEIKIESFRFGDSPTAAERLSIPASRLRYQLEQQLRKFQSEPGFDDLPAEQRDYVQNRIDEIERYLDYLDKIRQARSPADVTSEAKLTVLEDELRGPLKPRDEWAGTEADKLYQAKLRGVETLHKVGKELREWYRDSAEQAQNLLAFDDNRRPDPEWYREVKPLLDPARRPPYTGAEFLNDARTLRVDTVLNFPSVLKERLLWEQKKPQLERIRNIGAALGLLGPGQQPPPALAIPDAFTLKAAPALVAELKRAYPSYQTDFVLTGLPEGLAREISRMARGYYPALLAPAQAEVLRQLKAAGGEPRETRSQWDAVRQWLKSPTELTDWRVLANALAGLQGLPDPVTDLADFLQKTSFTVGPDTLFLEGPDDLKDRVPSNATLTITHGRAGAERGTLVYQVEDRPKRDGRVWRWKFTLKEGEKLSYQPGDELRATLPLLNNDALSWTHQHSVLYQFERLTQPPRLHKMNQADSEGTLQERIHLRSPEPADPSLPRLPDLVPWVRLE